MSKRNRGKPVTKAGDHIGDLSAFGGEYYTYRSDLTARLDAFEGAFSQSFINELVLWKVNRHVSVPAKLLSQLDGLRKWKKGQHEKARPLIADLLGTPGVRLPMASTFLRFANPDVFQIIDRHAYRAVYGKSFLADVKKKSVQERIDLYFAYLVRLRKLCCDKSIRFREADRILFVFDRELNPPLKETD